MNERVIDHSQVQNPGVSREHSDVESTPILKFGMWLAIGALAIHVMLWGLFEFFRVRDEAKIGEISPLRAKALKQLPPEPRLQLAPGHTVHPIEEMVQLRRYHDSILHSSRIPIEDAKRIIVEQSQNGAPLNDFMLPTDMSSGRMLERRDR
jgi:hypothetical protein